MVITMKDSVITFLLQAKRATYAGKGPESPSSRPCSHDYEYARDGFKYIDSYFGGKKFAGEEVLSEDNRPFWAMNYIGRVLADGFSGDFLKSALLKCSQELPFRGPESYCDGNLTYKNRVNGCFAWFYGYEEIYNGDIKVYECDYHGGLIE